MADFNQILDAGDVDGGIINVVIEIPAGSNHKIEWNRKLAAMQLDREPQSEVATLKFLMDNPEIFDERVVDALINSIQFLGAGTSVELNTGEKALVIQGNDENVLKPVVLCFKNNQIMDLSNEFIYGDIEIVDIMKTLDNRYIMDTKTLQSYGILVQEDFIPVEEDEEYTIGKDF